MAESSVSRSWCSAVGGGYGGHARGGVHDAVMFSFGDRALDQRTHAGMAQAGYLTKCSRIAL